jgi:hypothetical protein
MARLCPKMVIAIYIKANCSHGSSPMVQHSDSSSESEDESRPPSNPMLKRGHIELMETLTTTGRKKAKTKFVEHALKFRSVLLLNPSSPETQPCIHISKLPVGSLVELTRLSILARHFQLLYTMRATVMMPSKICTSLCLRFSHRAIPFNA